MDPIAVQMLRIGDIEAPARDYEALEEHRLRLREGRRAVDEATLGDYDIPLVFPAQGHDRDR